MSKKRISRRQFIESSVAGVAVTGMRGPNLYGQDPGGNNGADNPQAQMTLSDRWAIRSSKEVNATGEQISSVTYSPSGWYSTSAPTTVLAVLVKHRVYPDPYFGTNLATLPGYSPHEWLMRDIPKDSPFSVPWWYRTQFALPRAYQGTHMRLHLDGVNYKAAVWLNGHMVADDSQVEGPYRHFDLDITRYARPGETNCLALAITPPKGTDLTIRWMQGTRTPPDRDTGIWYDVRITSSGPVRMADPFVKTAIDLPSARVAQVNVSVNMANAGKSHVEATLEGEIVHIDNTAEGGTSTGSPGTHSFSRKVTLAPGETRLVQCALELTEPKLWWPNLVGPQNLYELSLVARQGAKVSDRAKVRFGIRKITASLETFGDKRVRVYQINGKKILIRGADYTQEMMMRSIPEHDEAAVRYAKTMNLNTLRLEGFWGTEYFGDLCDRYGIMLFEGTNCCSMWEEWPLWTDHMASVAVDSLKDQVVKKRNRPSVVQWVLGSDRYPPEDMERRYINVVETLDGTRPYLPCMGNRTTKIFGYTGYDKRPSRNAVPSLWYTAEGFNWESGAVGAEQIAPIESMRQMMPTYDLWPISGSWDIRLRYGGTVYYERARATFWKRYGQPRSLEEYCVASQAWQLETNRAALEAVAGHKYLTSGSLKYRFNTGWPALDFQYFDYYLRPNGAFYGAEKACEPLHVQYAYDENAVYIVNGYYRKFEGLRVRAEVRDFAMKVVDVRTASASIGEDESRKVLALPAVDGISRTYFLKLDLQDEEGRLISSNFYWLSAEGDPNAHFEDLKRLPPAEINVSSEIAGSGANGIARVRMRNPTGSLAFLTHVALLAGVHGSEVLPVYWSANYVSLLPGETVKITGVYDSKLLGGEEPCLQIDGWNVRPKELTLAAPNREVTPQLEYFTFVAPTKVGVNREFLVSVTVRNAATSGENILKDRQFLYLDGERSGYQRIALAPGESKRLLWNYVRFAKPGKHTVAIGHHPPAIVVVTP